ncbi:tetratricopeptide repeat protein [Candidatus Tisiphia endosymbiont of Micropterix aruncella]|uniref:tetratricopeptide repeat protein n=1 Tax=Candidatus Tisiphia endosymbiont of Micropterix aruncella TaxID=3066271 RepID=UPI003AA9A8CD
MSCTELFYKLGQFQNALVSIANATAIEKTGEMYYLEGQIYQELSQYPQAELSLKKSLELQDNSDVRDALIFVLAQQSKYSEVDLISGNSTINQHNTLDIDIDINTTQTDLYDTPTEAEINNEKYTHYYNNSIWSLRTKGYDKALKFIQQALSEKATGSAYYIKGLILKEQGYYDQALADFDTALLSDNDNRDKAYSIHCQRSMVYSKLSRYDESLAAVNKALQRKKTGFLANCIKGKILWIQEKDTEALFFLDKCLDFQPDPEIYYIKSLILDKQQNYEGALEAINMCLKHNGGSSEVVGDHRHNVQQTAVAYKLKELEYFTSKLGTIDRPFKYIEMFNHDIDFSVELTGDIDMNP